MTQVPRPAPLSRRVLLVFSSVMALITGELVWWVTFHVRTSNIQRLEHTELLESQRLLAAEMIVLSAKVNGPGPQLPSRLVAQYFSELQWRPGAFAYPELNALYPGYGVFVRDDIVTVLQHRHDSHLRMFVSEGAFFLGMVILGALLIVRTMRREVLLMRQQTNFLSAVTHELKSPLASIRLYTETMQLRDPPAATRERYLKAMRGDLDRLETLVGNLLAVARLDAGQFVVHEQELDVNAEVASLVRMLEPELHERGCAVQLTLGDAPVWVRFDPGALHTVVRNLLDNAVKYGGGKPVRIDVHALHDVGVAVIDVEDDGIGLPAGEAEKIFQKFYRVGDEMVRQAEGSGLGLYLVQTLVQQSGGMVTAHSAGLNQGTRFRITLPVLRKATS